MAAQRSLFEIIQCTFQNNSLKNMEKIFAISLLVSGIIRDCVFLNQTGETDGFFILVENAVFNIIFKVSLNYYIL